MGGGVLMALVAILHVIVAHFATGGGLRIVVAETLSVVRAATPRCGTSHNDRP
ncbi:MAG TPA: hypothetical protein VLT32_07615 [Candidatus Sulfomarinibacteraceae bacterium]|nr:hypothetical protein [Candidatus Sulfomarinibacteraceae bacterium]